MLRAGLCTSGSDNDAQSTSVGDSKGGYLILSAFEQQPKTE
jgi:hypothetical protein